ncbi:MAG: DUF3267 domain-containing protein [Clostridia bacterium]|nr:DUF3267 domain-containing protein [Clostridia bacterium]
MLNISPRKNFERELPEGYKLVVHLDAKSPKLGIIFNLIALVIAAVVIGGAIVIANLFGGARTTVAVKYIPTLLAFILAMLGYIVLHELTHGFFYKRMTGEKLTFGFSWSCAFCGVPHIYTYARTAKRSAAGPLVIFSAIFIPLIAICFFLNPTLYLLSVSLFAIHLGGCCGDMYILILIAKYKDPRMLIRDTGAEQFIYMPDGSAEA